MFSNTFSLCIIYLVSNEKSMKRDHMYIVIYLHIESEYEQIYKNIHVMQLT